jgi:hypothetical protein
MMTWSPSQPKYDLSEGPGSGAQGQQERLKYKQFA